MTTKQFEQALGHLQALGFGEYEARAYVTLVQHGILTGYQLAKISGVPRPNIYSVLDRLQQRGVVSRIEVKGGVKYSALQSEDVLSQLARTVEISLKEARSALQSLEGATPTEYIWNIEGYDALVARAESLVDSAKRQLTIGIWAEEAKRLSPAVTRAQERGVELTVLCIQGCEQECGGCRGRIYRYSLANEAETRWLIIVADDNELLVGQASSDGSAAGATTKVEVLVAMGAHYLRNTIAIAEIVRSLGARLPNLVDRQALEALQGADLATGGKPWLQRMLSALRRGSS